MRLTKTKGMYWSLMISIVMLAMPMWALAENPGTTPNIDQIKQVRQLQNQNTIVKNIKANSKQMNATADQARMLRLSKALAKATKQQAPRLEKSYSLNMGHKDIQIPSTAQRGSRAVLYNSGVLSDHPDSLYFNFLTGMNSSDSIGMDVRVTSNEGTNFGNEGASWGDPSLLHYFTPLGTLDDVYEAPLLTDPVWTTISWDWANGNNGQPLAVGNIWVVYARTSQLYVALEVTNVDPWGTYFEFDYMIQDDGSNVFDEMPPSLIDMTVNGVYADTLEIGSTPYFEITLDVEPVGEMMILWDANHDGMLDELDVPLEMHPFADNDDIDEDPTAGVFGFTYTDDMADGLNYLADDLLFVAFVGMDMAETSVHFYSMPTPFSVSGHAYSGVTDPPLPIEGIVVWAMYDMDEQPVVIAVTDADGYYQIDLPDTGMVMIGSEDHFFVTEGLMAEPPMHEAMVMGHEVDYDFIYVEPNAEIQGYVLDETGLPLEGIEVLAHGDGPGYSAFTDADGFYNMGVMPGWYMVELGWESLTAPYMLPFGEDIIIGDGEIYNLDLYVHTTNSVIGGTVLVDGVPFSDALAWAIHPEFGYSAGWTDVDGNFLLPVLDLGATVYDVGAFFEFMPNLIQVSDNMEVPAGTVDELVVFESLTSGLSGYFIDGTTGAPIENDYELGMGLWNIDTGMEYWTMPDPSGYYEIWVPDGLYEIMAGGTNWYMDTDTAEVVLIDGGIVNYDIILWPIGFDTFFEGYVYDNLGTPIMNAEVIIGNEQWGAGTFTDETGFYHFDVPAGYYGVAVYAEGYYDEYDEVDLTGGPQFYDFYLDPMVVSSVIHGVVLDLVSGLPLPEADVFLFGMDMAYNYYTDVDGEFWFDVPDGEYGLYIEHSQYIPFWIDGLYVENDTLYIEAPMAVPDGGLEGYVYDNENGAPILDAEVLIVNEVDSLGFWGKTDENGYYSIPAMNGDYQIFAYAPEYLPVDGGMITIEDAWIQMDLYLDIQEFAMAPEINFIIDQPFDQGRQVRMQFSPGVSEMDMFAGYSIWRLTNTPMGEIFDFVDYVPNHDLEAYNLVLPTLVDSNAYTPNMEDYMSLFMVTGHWDMYNYVDGMPAAGYSVDNIVPGVPGFLTLLSTGEDGVEIAWDASMADDFQYFEVYRSTTSDLADASVFTSVAPVFVDEDVTVGQTYYYAVSAVDANGNVSENTNIVTTSIVSVDDIDVMPTAYGLSQNFPNPFNPTTSIEFALPQASDVTLEIYNLLGQKVRTLVNGYTPAGYITTNWDGLDQNGKELSSGTYIYRLETADMSFAKKMVLMK